MFLAGAPLRSCPDTPQLCRQLGFKYAVFASGTPSIGFCAWLQVAAVAAGGTMRENRRGHKAAFACRITPTAAGLGHKLFAGRPVAYDAARIHSDGVQRPPEGATLLATNGGTRIMRSEIPHGGRRLFGMQYHLELSLDEVAGAMRWQAGGLHQIGLRKE